MPRVTANGQVTIPKNVRDTIGIEPGDDVVFVETESGYTIQKTEPSTADGSDPFEMYRGSAGSDETMPDRMRRLRGEHPRNVGDNEDGKEDEAETET